MTIYKDLFVYLLLYQSLYDPTVCNLKSVLFLTNTLGSSLISVLGLTNPLGCKLISALVLTCHLKCQAILLILFCFAAPFFNSPRLFLFSISVYTTISFGETFCYIIFPFFYTHSASSTPSYDPTRIVQLVQCCFKGYAVNQ